MSVDLKRLWIQVGGMFVVIGLVLFLAAGTVAWVAGWVFLLLFVAFTVVLSRWLLSHDPGLLTERLTGASKADQKPWDKAFYVGANGIFLAWLVVMPLDAMRFRWSYMPGWLQAAGAVLLLCSFYLFFLTFRENAYLSPVVRLQTERGHTVVSSGMYQVVRHPMYAAAIIFLVGTTMVLGSWYGIIPALILIIAIAVRAVHEERTLQAELPGYVEYMKQVTYRVIPGIW